MDAKEITEQLLKCLDTALQKVVSRALEVDAFSIYVDTITHELLTVIELLAAEEVEKAMYNDYGGENDTFSPTDVISQIEEQAVVVVDEDIKQEVVPVVKILPLLYGQSGGQKGGAQGIIIPKTFARYEEPSCKFSMELDDDISALRVLENHKFVAHKRQVQHHQQGLCGRKGGQKRGAIYLHKTHRSAD